MGQDTHSGRDGNNFGHDIAREVARQLGLKFSGHPSSNECHGPDGTGVIKSDRTSKRIGVLKSMLPRLKVVYAVLRSQGDEYEVFEVPRAVFDARKFEPAAEKSKNQWHLESRVIRETSKRVLTLRYSAGNGGRLTARSPMIVCNIGWMSNYRGLAHDTIKSSAKYITERSYGHEIYNFDEFKGRRYGYVQPPGDSIDLSRLGADPGSDSLDDVLIVWSAPNPRGGTSVIGWYDAATLYSTQQQAPVGSQRGIPKHAGQCGYFAEAPTANCRLLEPDERTLIVPRGKNGMGQALIWYADTPLGEDFRNRFEEFRSRLGSGKSPQNRPSTGPRRQADAEKRAKVEKAAILAVGDWYEGRGYTVHDVQDQNKGWDLEAQHTDGGEKLLIEVKGLSGAGICAEVTPNEFRQMEAMQHSYRLVVVTQALNEKESQMARFCYAPESRTWQDQNGRQLNIEEIVAARVSA